MTVMTANCIIITVKVQNTMSYVLVLNKVKFLHLTVLTCQTAFVDFGAFFLLNNFWHQPTESRLAVVSRSLPRRYNTNTEKIQIKFI